MLTEEEFDKLKQMCSSGLETDCWVAAELCVTRFKDKLSVNQCDKLIKLCYSTSVVPNWHFYFKYGIEWDYNISNFDNHKRIPYDH